MAERPPLVCEWLVVEARDHVQVRVVRGLTDLGKAVPDQRVAVRCKTFILCGLRLEEKLARRRPLLSREIERREAMHDGDDDPTPGSTSGGSRGSRVEAYRQKAFSKHTSAARNLVRSQKTQPGSLPGDGDDLLL